MANCTECKERRAATSENKEKHIGSVPVIVYEASNERFMRIIKWLIIVIAVLISVFAGYIVTDKILEQQEKDNYDYYEYVQDGEGLNNINGGEQGDVMYEPNVARQTP